MALLITLPNAHTTHSITFMQLVGFGIGLVFPLDIEASSPSHETLVSLFKHNKSHIEYVLKQA
jgi:hypothetical protein